MAVWILLLDPNAGRPRAAWAGWRPRDVLLTLAAAFCLRGTALYVWVVLLFQREGKGGAAVPQLTQNLGSGAWQVLACLVAVGAFALAPYGLPVDALGLVPPADGWMTAALVVGVAAGPGGVLLFVLIGRLTRDPMTIEGAQADFIAPRGGPRPPRYAVAGMILMGVVLAPVAEEALFRGVVYPGLRAAAGPWLAVVLSAVLFGLGHRDHGTEAVVFTALMGAALALLVEGSGSLWPAVVAHVLVNTKLVLMYVGPLRGRTVT
jgi:membrane protease YdiL (CAAX protease family)